VEWPESIQVRDGEGNYPVHIATLHQDESTLRFVVRAWPDSIRAQDASGNLPVHLAAREWQIENLRCLLEEWPGSVNEVNHSGATPLHVLLGNNRYVPVADLARSLLERSPLALRIADDVGRLPLHYAASRLDGTTTGEDAAELIRVVAEGWPAAFGVADSDGNLPLHLALSGHASVDRVRAFVEPNPDALLRRNRAGWLPVQVALARDPPSSMDVVRLLIAEGPGALQDCDASGRVLLHYLASLEPRKALDGIDRDVVDKWPEALQVRDSAGLLPLHVAASATRPSLDLVYRLARQRPDLLVYSGVGGGDLPARRTERSPFRSGPHRGRSGRAKKKARA
jgi:ankyrin repeat protein